MEYHVLYFMVNKCTLSRQKAHQYKQRLSKVQKIIYSMGTGSRSLSFVPTDA